MEGKGNEGRGCKDGTEGRGREMRERKGISRRKV